MEENKTNTVKSLREETFVLLRKARKAAEACLSAKLDIHGGAFRFLPEERPKPFLGGEHVPILFIEKSRNGYIVLHVKEEEEDPWGETDLSTDDIDISEIIFLADRIPEEPVDYETADKDWKTLEGVHTVVPETKFPYSERGYKVTFLPEKHTFLVRNEDDSEETFLGFPYGGTSACRHVTAICDLVRGGLGVEEAIKAFFGDFSTFELPF